MVSLQCHGLETVRKLCFHNKQRKGQYVLQNTLHYRCVTGSLSAMTRLKASGALVEGCATAEGTQRFKKRFSKKLTDHFYRPLADGCLVSSLGLGTYLGECDDTEEWLRGLQPGVPRAVLDQLALLRVRLTRGVSAPPA